VGFVIIGNLIIFKTSEKRLIRSPLSSPCKSENCSQAVEKQARNFKNPDGMGTIFK